MRASREWYVWAVLITTCLIFGSIYVVLRIAIATLPPFLIAGTRFLVSGALLFGLSLFPYHERPTASHWQSAAILGTLSFLCANGAVVWAQPMVTAGLTALLLALTPVFVVLLEWIWPGGHRPRIQVGLGLLLGCSGILFLAGPSSLAGTSVVAPAGLVALTFASLFSALAVILIQRINLPSSFILGAAMQMLIGGTLLVVAGSIAGDWGRLQQTTVSTGSVLALAYLIVVGTVIAFTANYWLLRTGNATLVSSITSYSSPVIAVLLGWMVLGETLTPRLLVGGTVVLVGLGLITRYRHRPQNKPSPTLDLSRPRFQDNS